MPRDRQGWSVRVVLLIALAVIGLVVTMLFVAVSSGIERPAEQLPSGTAATTDPSSDPSYWTRERMRETGPGPAPTGGG